MRLMIQAVTGYLGVFFGTAADVMWMTVAGVLLPADSDYEVFFK